MGTDTMRECAEQIEALATLLQESMEYGTAAAMIAEFANDIQTMTRNKPADRTA